MTWLVFSHAVAFFLGGLALWLLDAWMAYRKRVRSKR